MSKIKTILKYFLKFGAIILPIIICIILFCKEISVYHSIGLIKRYRTNIILQQDIDSQVDGYNSASARLEETLGTLKKLGAVTDEDRINFIGYIGKSINQNNIDVKNITFVNLKNYVEDMSIKVGEEAKSKVQDVDPLLKTILVDSVNSGTISTQNINDLNKKKEKETEIKQDGKEDKNKQSQGTSQPVNNTQKVEKTDLPSNAILIELEGNGGRINTFIQDLEKFYFKYFYVSIINLGDTSRIRILIDLR